MKKASLIINNYKLENKALVKFIESNTKEAFRLILSENKERVYWHIRKMVLDHEDANDLTQETFIKVWKNLKKYKGDSKVYTWIHRIATNLCLTFLEKQKKDPTEEFKSSHITKGQHNTIGADDVIIQLLIALKQLSAKQRLVFSLKYFDNMKYHEIEALTGTKIGTLKATYHMAIKKIKSFLNPEINQF